MRAAVPMKIPPCNAAILAPPPRSTVNPRCDKVAPRRFPRLLDNTKGSSMPGRKLTRQDLRDAAEKYKNWGKWGPKDEIGTLNHTQPEDIVAAARLVKKGKVISLALNFDNAGPQGAKSKYPAMGRINPVHTMLRTGTDAYSGVLDHRGIRAAESQDVKMKRGDFVVVRTGQMEAKLKAGSWDGYPGGDAPGFAFETLEWIKRTELAALASDTWGCEVRPNETEPGINQPWHWITIPMMGMTMGEIFYVKELAEDCAADKVYEFLFVAPAIPITGAVGSPTNPLAIK